MINEKLTNIVCIKRKGKLLKRSVADIIQALLMLLWREFAVVDMALPGEPEDSTQVAHLLRHDLSKNDKLSDGVHVQNLMVKLDAHLPFCLYLRVMDCFDELAHSLLLTFSQYEVIRDDAPAFLPCLVRFETDCVLKWEVFDPYLIDKALIRLYHFEGLAKAVLFFPI